MPAGACVRLRCFSRYLLYDERRKAPIMGGGRRHRAGDVSRLSRAQPAKRLCPPSVPYFIYRGERLKVDYNGSRGVLFDTKRLHLDSGINASVPVKSDDPMRAAAYRTSTPRSSLGRCSNTI